jgi:hypothetical protein
LGFGFRLEVEFRTLALTLTLTLVFRAPTDKRKVLCLCYLMDDLSDSSESTADYKELKKNQNIIVTAGIKHLKFWWSQGQNISSQRGLFGKEEHGVILSIASGSPGICVTGELSLSLSLSFSLSPLNGFYCISYK